MDSNVKKVLEVCQKFIDEHTPEELIEYEKNLNLDYDKYKLADESTSEKLKICPFCGGNASSYIAPSPNPDIKYLYYIECDKCEMCSRGYISEKEAITAWNIRKSE